MLVDLAWASDGGIVAILYIILLFPPGIFVHAPLCGLANPNW